MSYKKDIVKGINSYIKRVKANNYAIDVRDLFVLGYMFGKYDLKDWSQKELMRGCKEYDKKDELMLLDTIGETLIDLDFIDNSNNEI